MDEPRRVDPGQMAERIESEAAQPHVWWAAAPCLSGEQVRELAGTGSLLLRAVALGMVGGDDRVDSETVVLLAELVAQLSKRCGVSLADVIQESLRRWRTDGAKGAQGEQS